MPGNAHHALISVALTCTLFALSSSSAQTKNTSYTPDQAAALLGWQANPNKSCGGRFVTSKNIGNIDTSTDIKNTETHLHASGPNTLALSGESTLRNHVVITQPGRRIEADKATVSRNAEGHITHIAIDGHINLYEPDKHIASNQMSLSLPSNQVDISMLLYQLSSQDRETKAIVHRWGSANKASQDPNKVIHLTNARFSSCDPTNPAWVLTAKHLSLNPKTGKGNATMALLRWYGIPLLWVPYYSFPINSDRHTGFLTPSFTHNTNTGFAFSLPFYWNIAPNKSLTLTPQWMSARGFGLNSQFRFIDQYSINKTRVQWTPDDTHLSDEKASATTAISNSNDSAAVKAIYQDDIDNLPSSRYQVSLSQSMQMAPDLGLDIKVNRVSDPYYLRDMDGLGDSAEDNQLRNQVAFSYQTPHWQGYALVQSFQTLYRYDQPEYTVLTPYQRLPEVTANAYYPHLGNTPIDATIESSADYFYFDSPFVPKQTMGWRFHARPGLSSTLTRAWGSLSSSLWLDTTAYENTHKSSDSLADSPTRIAPIVTLDATTSLSHDFSWHDHERTNIIRPRLYYLYVPKTNQDSLPNYDSYELPFTFSQLFALNRFSGYDRLQNANQVSIALTDDLIDTKTGTPLLSVDLGIEQYFTRPTACLTTGCTESTGSVSPLVADIRVPLYRHWEALTGAAWDTHRHRINNASIQLNYSRNKDYQIGIGYQYTHKSDNPLLTPGENTDLLLNDSTNELKLGGQWKLTKRWHGLAYIDYDFDNNRINSYYGGVEYDACCWQIQLLVRRAYISSTINTSSQINNQFNTGVYFNLVLTGLGNLGNTSSLQHLLDTTQPGRNPLTLPS